jgi:WD40 repeat protein
MPPTNSELGKAVELISVWYQEQQRTNMTPLSKVVRCLRLVIFCTFAAVCIGFQTHSTQTSYASSDRVQPALELQAGHAGSVFGLSFSPKGRLLASAGSDGSIKIWDLRGGRELRTLSGHAGQATSVAFNPDGSLLASAGTDKTINIWNAMSGELVKSLTGHSGAVLTVAFSPDGQLLASAGAHGEVKIWSVSQSRVVASLEGHLGWVTKVAFNADGRLLASAGEDKTVRLWDVSSWTQLRALAGHTDSVTAIVFSSDGRLLASGGRDRTIRLWQIPSGQELRTIPADKNQIGALAFSPDGKWLASGGYDGQIKIWTTSEGSLVRTLTHGDWIFSLSFSPNGLLLASGGLDKTIRIWDPESGAGLRTFSGAASYISSLAIGSSGRFLVSGDGDGRLGMWDLSAGKEAGLLRQNRLPVLGVSLSPDGRSLAAGGLKKAVNLWDSYTSNLRELSGHDKDVNAVAFSPDGKLLASGSSDDTVRVWNPATGLEVRTLIGHTKGVEGVAFSPNGELLASASLDGEVRLWRVTSGDSIAVLHGNQGGVKSVAFSPDGSWLASGGLDGSVELWDLATRSLRSLKAHSDVVTSLAFSPDSRWLASGSDDKTVRIWNVASGNQLHNLQAKAGSVTSVIFIGRWLVSGCWDGSMRLWDPETGTLAATLIAFGNNLDWVVVTPEGLFDGSEAGVKLVAWRVGSRVYPVDRFMGDYYSPGLLARILHGDTPKVDVNIAELKLPPDINIVSPISQTVEGADKALLAVNVEVTDQGGGLSEIRLYQNEKLVEVQEVTDVRQNAYRHKFDVVLVPGFNRLRVRALSKERIESNDDSVELILQSPQPKPKLYILAVGINEYEDPLLHLNFARQDGQAIASFFQQHAGRLFQDVKVISIFDGDATQRKIRASLEELRTESRKEDVVIIYLAGHGVTVGQQFYFLPHETHLGHDIGEDASEYGLSATALGLALARIPALKELLILDACQSETALKIIAKSAMFRGDPAEVRAEQMLARNNGIYLISATTSQEYAVEVPELRHGVLTSALLSGLGESGSPRADVNTQGFVTVESLLSYVKKQVPELMSKYEGGARQEPVSASYGMDFPLVLR